MTVLSSNGVQTIFLGCLFKTGESTNDAALVEGVTSKFGFHPERLTLHKPAIKAMLSELPDEFWEFRGGGWSFLNACMDRHGNQWGEHRSIEQLLCLGIAMKLAKWQLPRELWSSLPGGMPYVVLMID